jgi:hypothetical protein
MDRIRNLLYQYFAFSQLFVNGGGGTMGSAELIRS